MLPQGFTSSALPGHHSARMSGNGRDVRVYTSKCRSSNVSTSSRPVTRLGNRPSPQTAMIDCVRRRPNFLYDIIQEERRENRDVYAAIAARNVEHKLPPNADQLSEREGPQQAAMISEVHIPLSAPAGLCKPVRDPRNHHRRISGSSGKVIRMRAQRRRLVGSRARCRLQTPYGVTLDDAGHRSAAQARTLASSPTGLSRHQSR